MGEMTEKTYKVRVQMEMIVEFEVDAVHEDNAAAIAEEQVAEDAEFIVEDVLKHPFFTKGYAAISHGAKCIEVEECSEPN